MTQPPSEIVLGPEEEADRLWAGSLAASKRAGEDLMALCEALDLGLHAAEILAIQQLQQVKSEFPATIALQLDTPDPEVEVARDSGTTPKALQFTDVIDLLSEESTDCVSAHLHRGWEDRRFSCRRSRATAQRAVGLTLERGERDKLLVLSAYRNRIFRDPPPVKIRPPMILDGYRVLEALMNRLRAARGAEE